MARTSSPGMGGFVTPILLLPALVAGGGSTLGLVSDGWLSAAAIVAIAGLLAAHFTGLRPIHRAARPLLLLVCGLFALGLAQAYWTSHGLWWNDASRLNARTGLELADIPVDGPWSLAPDDTLMFLLRWLPPIAMLLAVAGAGPKERHRTVALLGVLGLIAAMLTMAQQFVPALQPYRSDTGVGIGWFANPNHHGLFLACGIAAALLALPVHARTAHRRATGLELSRPLILAAGAVLVGLMAVLLTGSRAALPLFLIALTLALLARPHQRVRPSWFTILLIALPVLVAIALLVPHYVDTAFTGPSLAEDPRWAALSTIVSGAIEALPWGTGFGTFERAYLGIEPLDLLGERALNEAHNEPVQWLFEGGVAGLLLLSAFLVLLWKRGRQRLRDREACDLRAMRAGAIIVGLIALHSLVDYPARTVALGSLAMTALALWLVPAVTDSPASGQKAKIAVLVAAAGAILVVPLLNQPFAQRAGQDAVTDARGLAVSARAIALAKPGPNAEGEALAKGALARAPLEASAYEALALSSADFDRSNRFIDAGIAISRRSGILPSLKFQRLLADAQFEEAVEQAVTLLRREEPDPNFLRSVRLAALDDAFARGLARELEPTRHWTTPLFAYDENADALEVEGARRLLLAMKPAKGGPPPHLIEATLQRLIDDGEFDQAAELRARLYPDRSAFDVRPYPSARTRTDTTLFDWRFAKVNGVRIGASGARLDIAGRGRADEPIAWRYLDLAPGRHRLAFSKTASGEGDGLAVEVLCAGGSILAEAQPAGRTDWQADFAIDDACPLALVRLRAVPTPRSYRLVLDDWSVQSLPGR